MLAGQQRREPSPIDAVDLFCGAGGTSTGMQWAVEHDMRRPLNLVAINHWPTAINTHSLNHPRVRHICGRLENIRPREAVPGGRLDLLAASPECTHHSIAAGGLPKNDQSRCQAWLINHWLSNLDVESLLIENVREFLNWGPLGRNKQPLKRRKGEYFKAWVESLRSMGYHLDFRVLNAADYGDPTNRRRLILLARKGRKVEWPEASHGAGLKPWRAAREIIDWNLKGKSIFSRERPLSPNTIRRIIAGLRKFGGANAQPFLVMLCHSQSATGAMSIDDPLDTITTARGGEFALAEPFKVATNHGTNSRTENHRAKSLEEPVPTLTQAGSYALVEPFLVKFHGDHAGRHDGEARNHPINEPIPTLDTSNRFGIVEPMLIGEQSCAAARPVSEPTPTISTAGAIALVEPFLVKYYGSGGSKSIDVALDTITSKPRFGLVETKTGRVVGELDILFRMLQPHELSAAMSFPKSYKFTGTKCDQVKQIGNAVPVELARACAKAVLN